MKNSEPLTKNDIKKLALYLAAPEIGLEEAESYAEKKGLVFDKDAALHCIEVFSGEQEAEFCRHMWDEKRMQASHEAFLAKFRKVVEEHQPEDASNSTLGNLVLLVKRSFANLSEQVADTLTTAPDLSPNALAFRDAANSADMLPPCDVTLDVEGNKLFISVELNSDRATAFADNIKLAITVGDSPINLEADAHTWQVQKHAIDIILGLGEAMVTSLDKEVSIYMPTAKKEAYTNPIEQLHIQIV